MTAPVAGRSPVRRALGRSGVVQHWYDADQRDAGRVRGVAFGTGGPSAVERALGARAGDEDWEQRLSEALGQARRTELTLGAR